MKLISLAILAVLAVPAIRADDLTLPPAFRTTAQIVAELNSDDHEARMAALGYLAGVSDSVDLSRAASHGRPCPNHKLNELSALFVAYSILHPEYNNWPATFVAMKADCTDEK
jgi:hypothetical protein